MKDLQTIINQDLENALVNEGESFLELSNKEIMDDLRECTGEYLDVKSSKMLLLINQWRLNRGDIMKELSVYVLRNALGKLPCAESHFRNNNGSPYFVQVPTLLQAVKDKEPWNHSREDGQHIKLTFVAKQTVQNAGGCRWFDWVLKDVEEVKVLK